MKLYTKVPVIPESDAFKLLWTVPEKPTEYIYKADVYIRALTCTPDLNLLSYGTSDFSEEFGRLFSPRGLLSAVPWPPACCLPCQVLCKQRCFRVSWTEMEAEEVKSRQASGNVCLSYQELLHCFETPLVVSYVLVKALHDQERCSDFWAQLFIFCLQKIPAWANFHNKEKNYHRERMSMAVLNH